MGYRIENNQIWLTRGDTLKCTLSLTNKSTGQPYELSQGDAVRFALKHDRLNPRKTEYNDKTPIITKAISIATMGLTIDPEDTEDLDFGEYVYDIQVTFADQSVDTVIEASPFHLTYEVD